MRETETGEDRVEGGRKIGKKKQLHSRVSPEIEDRVHIIV